MTQYTDVRGGIDDELRSKLIRLSNDMRELRNLVFALLLMWLVGLALVFVAISAASK